MITTHKLTNHNMKHKLIILTTNELNQTTVVIIGGTIVACLYMIMSA